MSSTVPLMVPPRLPRYRRAASPLQMRITPARHQVLKALARYDYLVAPQINTLLGRKPASLTSTQEHLKLLYHSAYLQRLWLPTVTPMGSSMAIYCLDNLGYQYLAALGQQPEGRFRASELARREFAFLRHHLQANELLVLAERLAQCRPEVSLARLRTDRHLRREPVYVGPARERVAVIPDGWVDLRVGDGQACIAFELDRGTERRKKVEAKLHALLDYSRGPYQQAFNTESLTIAWVVAEGASGRADELLHWTEELLRERSATEEAGLFLVATFNPSAADPDAVFLGRIWRRPFEAGPVTLLEGAHA